MKKMSLVLALVLVLMLSQVAPVAASLSITGVYYNFDAAENEWALKVDWTGRPAFEIKANEFYQQRVRGQDETLVEVEARIQEKFNDLLVDDAKLSTIDPEDPTRQDPPILELSEEIVIINNQEYLRVHRAFFRIHFYSLDDLETPGSELSFITRFQNPNIGPIPDDWWQGL